MTDYIKRAVELADGWNWLDGKGKWAIWAPWNDALLAYSAEHIESQWVLDALAAQLVRQVDAIENFELLIRRDVTQLINVYSEAFEMDEMIEYSGGHGRTMNTIRAIVDSGVLE